MVSRGVKCDVRANKKELNFSAKAAGVGVSSSSIWVTQSSKALYLTPPTTDVTFFRRGHLTIIELLFTFHTCPRHLITHLFVTLRVSSIDNNGAFSRLMIRDFSLCVIQGLPEEQQLVRCKERQVLTASVKVKLNRSRFSWTCVGSKLRTSHTV